jgi:para-nitrobenzyl esterase
VNGAIADTRYGKVEGATKGDVLVFRGIPYARPPAGDLRYRAPQPPVPWADVRNATRYGPMAHQNPSPLEQALAGGRLDTADECLTANVWTPGLDGSRPVMVWIHGGAFVGGSGSTPWYRAASLAHKADVVVVTFNYRLGSLGFLHLEDVAGPDFAGTGNLGILDQVAALQWVRDNVEGFGGDPANITVFGESAGGMSIGTLLGLPAGRDLFGRAILQSGAAHHVLDREEANRITHHFLEEMGMEPARAAELRQAPVERMLAAQLKVSERTRSVLAFCPVVDGHVLPEPPIDAIARGDAAAIPVVAGTTLDEMRLFSVMDPRLQNLSGERLETLVGRSTGSPDRARGLIAAYAGNRPGASPSDLWNAIETDRVFRVPAVRVAERQAAHQPSTFMYLFTWPSSAFDGRLGACHALDIPFVFDALKAPGVDMFLGEVDDAALELSVAMQEAWTSFARTGKPVSSHLPDWPAYDPDRRATMLLGEGSAVDDDPYGDERRLWDDLR